MAKTSTKTRKTTKTVAKSYERTEEEIAYMQDFQARKAAKRQLPKITLKIDDDRKTGILSIKHDDPEIANALMLDAFGTMDEHFFDGLSKQLANAGGQDFDFMLSVVAGIEPKDQVEAMLAAQMAAVHMATMTSARRLAHVDNIPQQDSAEKTFNKLARTFTTQMEALNRHRGKGQQKMTVEHVTVNDGGQAIVGNVEPGGASLKKRKATP